jgi:hypothetical protein
MSSKIAISDRGVANPSVLSSIAGFSTIVSEGFVVTIFVHAFYSNVRHDGQESDFVIVGGTAFFICSSSAWTLAQSLELLLIA